MRSTVRIARTTASWIARCATRPTPTAAPPFVEVTRWSHLQLAPTMRLDVWFSQTRSTTPRPVPARQQIQGQPAGEPRNVPGANATMTQDAPIPVFLPMTSSARTVLPTDLVALVSLDGRVYSNEAMTADRVGTQDSPHPLETAFEQWFSFATGRHTWISVKGPTLRGLISARKRGSKLAWEVDCLIDAAEDDSGVLMSLLDQVTEAAGRSGALKVFLRLPSGSFTERVASRCEFAAVRRERTYRRSIEGDEEHNVPGVIRRREKA